jgi:hypothetical protein
MQADGAGIAGENSDTGIGCQKTDKQAAASSTVARRYKYDHFRSGICLLLMDAQEAQTLQLHEIVVWIPDGMKGEVVVIDGSGVKVRWEDGQCGYYQFTDLLSQIERQS